MAIITSRRTKRANAKNFRMALSPLADTTDMPTTVPADVNPSASSHDNAPASRPEVASTTVESTPKPVHRRSLSEMAPSPLPDTTEMLTTIPGDVNPPALSHNYAPVSRPEVATTTVESTPKPVLRRSLSEMAPSPLPDTAEMLTTIPGDVNPPALSHDNAPVSRPEVAQTAAGSPPKPVLRRSERQRRPPKHLSGFVLTKP